MDFKYHINKNIQRVNFVTSIFRFKSIEVLEKPLVKLQQFSNGAFMWTSQLKGSESVGPIKPRPELEQLQLRILFPIKEKLDSVGFAGVITLFFYYNFAT